MQPNGSGVAVIVSVGEGVSVGVDVSVGGGSVCVEVIAGIEVGCDLLRQAVNKGIRINNFMGFSMG